ncbi:MAG: GspH/FimT family pseudopilin [Woeseiaceae bacterium]|nr:GspH/FimT family pseudopilin [Woeseiaceae bacterium]
MRRRTQSAGYSLYELLMTLALVAVLLGIGLPSFGTLAADQRLRAQVDPLFHAVHLARKTSIARRRVVTLCASREGTRCDAGFDWSDGWLLFVNADRDSPPAIDPGEAVLRHHRGDPRVRISANRRAFTLRATELRATNGTLVFCDRAGRAASRALVISYTGRPRVARADRSGTPYACPD